MPHVDAQKRSWGSFWSLVVIQSMNSLNEKTVQFLLIALGIWLSVRLQYPLSVLCVLPFVLFSPLGGWLADRYCKTRILQYMVLLQVVVLVGMTAGLFLENLGMTVAFFAGFCVQAMFFSPAKKGLVKDMVGSERIGVASGILEISSMLALLVGQIGALWIVYTLLCRWGSDAGWRAAAWPCACCTAAAVLVYLLSLSLKDYAPKGTRPFRLSICFEHFSQLRMLWNNRILRFSEVGIGYFWFIAGVMVLIVLQMAEEAHPIAGDSGFMQVLGQQKDSALLFAWLSGGSILGGVLASLICMKRIHTWVARVGGVGMTLGCLLLAIQPYGTAFFLLTLAMPGFMAAGYLVPLNALLQDRADDNKRGDVIAAGNLVDCFLGIMSVVVQGGMSALGLHTSVQCALMALLSGAVAVFIFRATAAADRSMAER